MVTLREKVEIRDLLKAYCERYESQNRAAASLKGISAGTVSQILNDKWELISDEMWNGLQAQLTTGSSAAKGGWQVVETSVFNDVYFALKNAQSESAVTWVVSAAGSGKTETAQLYLRENRNVYYLLCDNDMRKYDFVRELARAIGIKVREGERIRTLMMEKIIPRLSEKNCPLLIFDEGDKLSDNILYYFITIYNKLKEKTGIVFLSTSYIKRRMATGINYDKMGYQEISSRIGQKFFDTATNNANDVFAICKANGVVDEHTIDRIIKDAEQYKFDLRRVYKRVKAELAKKGN